jgi:hypothetical protein
LYESYQQDAFYILFIVTGKQTHLILKRSKACVINKCWLLLLMIIAAASLFIPCSAGVFLPESLHVVVSAGGQAIIQETTGLKGNESGIFQAGMAKAFSREIFARLRISGSRSLTVPVIEDASVNFKVKGLSGSFGMLSTRMGRAGIYRPFSVFNRFTRESVIWDSWGFGTSLSQQLGAFNLGGAATLNYRENAAVHMLLEFSPGSVFTNRLLFGIQSCDLDFMDNFAVFGNDAYLALRLLHVHCSVKYQIFMGYGNVSIEPGNVFEFFTEAGLSPAQSLTLSAMAYYKKLSKNYDLTTVQTGIDVSWMFLRYVGIYGGYEFQNSGNIASHIPTAGIDVIPGIPFSRIRIGLEHSYSDNVRIERLTAIVRFEF